MEIEMTPKFSAGQRVRFNDRILSECPKYRGVEYEVLALNCDGWEIGRAEWAGQYGLRNLSTGQSVGSHERCLVAL